MYSKAVAILKSSFGAECLFLLLTLGFFIFRFFDLITGRGVFGPYQDNVYIHAPLFSTIAKIAQSGQDPVWMPYFFSGIPLYDSPYFSITYPFYFFHSLAYGDLVHSLHALTQVTLFHLLLFAGNTYVMCRVVGGRPAGAFIGAALSLIAGNTIAYASWVTITAPYAWMPLFIAGCVRLIQSPRSLSGIVMTTGGATLMTLAGPSQAVIHALAWAALFFGCGVVHLIRSESSKLLHLGKSLVWVGLTTACLSAVAVIPMYLATSTMIRFVGKGMSVEGYAPIPWKGFTEAQMTVLDSFRTVWPGPTHAIVGSPYVGPIALVGVVLALVGWWKKEPTAKFIVPAAGIIGLYFLWSSFGSNLGLAYVNYHIPFLNKIREPGRNLVMFVIMTCLLSGLGYTYLVRLTKSLSGTWRGRCFLVALGLCLSACVLAPPATWTATKANGVIEGLVLGVVLALVFIVRSEEGAVATAFVVSLLPLNHAIVTNGAVPVEHSPIVAGDQPLLNVLAALSASIPDVHNFRVNYEHTRIGPGWWAMDGLFFGLHSTSGWLQPVIADRLVIQRHLRLPNIESLFGVKYIVSEQHRLSTLPGAPICLSVDGYSVFRNDAAVPRVSLVDTIAGQLTRPEEIFGRARLSADLKSHAWLLASDYPTVRSQMENTKSRSAVGKGSSANIVSASYNRLAVATQSTRPLILRLNEIYSPDWHVSVNHKNLPTFRVDGYLTGTVVPAGNHTISFKFAPSLFRWLRYLQRAALALVVAMGAYLLVRRAMANDRKVVIGP